MANEQDIKVGITTEADTRGAEKAVAAIDKVVAKSEVRQRTTADFLAESADKARVAEVAFYDLDKEMGKTTRTSETLSPGITKVGKSSADAGRSLLLFSQGAEDAQYGMRGVLNNIPGLVLALGGTAGIAGAVSIAAVSFSVLYEWMTKTEAAAEDMSDAIGEVARNMGSIEADRVNDLFEALDASADAAEALRQGYENTRAADARFSVAALDNAEKLRQAQRNIAEALGMQVDSYKELQAIAAAEEKKRLQAAEQAVAMELQKLAAADQARERIADDLGAQKATVEVQKVVLVQEQAKLEVLRAQREELDKMVNGPFPSFHKVGEAFDLKGWDAYRKKQVEAETKLADPAFIEELTGQQNKIDALAAKIDAITKADTGKIAKLEVALQASQNASEDLAAAVDTNIQGIEQSLAADNLLARSQTLVETGRKFAGEINNALSGFEATNDQQQAAKQSLLAAAADGRITADEVRAVSDGLQTLGAQLQNGLAGTGENVRSLIAIVRQMQGVVAQQTRDIQAIKQINAQ